MESSVSFSHLFPEIGEGSAPFVLEYEQKRCFTSERDEAQFARPMAVNLAGVVTAMRAMAQVVGEGGRIISVVSWFSSCVRTTGLADYSVTKAAIAEYKRG